METGKYYNIADRERDAWNIIWVDAVGDTLKEAFEGAGEEYSEEYYQGKPHNIPWVAYRIRDEFTGGWHDLCTYKPLEEFKQEWAKLSKEDEDMLKYSEYGNCRCGGAGACMECNPGMFIDGIIHY